MKNTNIIYMLNGSIGDFLMVLVLMKAIHENDTKKEFSLFISTPRNVKEFRCLASEYPFVSVVDKSIFSIGKFLFSKNYVITPPTLGKNPLHVKIITWLLTFLRGKSIGFDDSFRFNKLFYSELLPFNPRVLFIELIFQVLPILGISSVNPETGLSFKRVEIKENKPYIVFHPFGSNNGRSIMGSKLGEVVSYLSEMFPEHHILISGSNDDSTKVKNLEGLNVKSIAGKYKLSEMPSVIENADLYIGVDTGITHLASVIEKRSLVIAENGTPHWLPYYNKEAKIIYKVKDSVDNRHEGREYLESKREDKDRYLDRVPLEIIKNAISIIKSNE